MTAEKFPCWYRSARTTTFALLTEPERLRRWQAVTARVELRAGRRVPLDDRAGSHGARHDHRARTGQAARVHLRLGGLRGPTARCLDRDDHPRADRGRDRGTPRPQRPHARAGRRPPRGLDATTPSGSSPRPRTATPAPTIGAPPSRPIPSTAAEASLAVCQLVLRDLRARTRRARRRPVPEFTFDQLVEHLVGSVSSLGLGRRGRGGSRPAA